MTHTTTLTENRLKVKRYAVKDDFGHFISVPNHKDKRQFKVKTSLQELFLKRLKEELRVGTPDEISANALSERAGGPAQTTLSEILRGADPRLETIHQISTALNTPAWELFLEKQEVVRLRTGSSGERPVSVTSFPGYPKMLDPEVKKSERKVRDRKRRTR